MQESGTCKRYDVTFSIIREVITGVTGKREGFGVGEPRFSVSMFAYAQCLPADGSFAQPAVDKDVESFDADIALYSPLQSLCEGGES